MVFGPADGVQRLHGNMGKVFLLHFGQGHFRGIQQFAGFGQFVADDVGGVRPENGDIGIGRGSFPLDVFKRDLGTVFTGAEGHHENTCLFLFFFSVMAGKDIAGIDQGQAADEGGDE